MQKAAFGILFNATRTKVLLVKRRDVPIWVLPGGGIEPKELPELAALREVQEETGLDTEVARHVAHYTPNGPFTADTYVYELKEVPSLDNTLKLSDETVDIGFFPINSLPHPYFSVHGLWIQDALSNEKEVIKKPLQGVSFKTIALFALKSPILFLRYIFSRLSLSL